MNNFTFWFTFIPIEFRPFDFEKKFFFIIQHIDMSGDLKRFTAWVSSLDYDAAFSELTSRNQYAAGLLIALRRRLLKVWQADPAGFGPIPDLSEEAKNNRDVDDEVALLASLLEEAVATQAQHDDQENATGSCTPPPSQNRLYEQASTPIPSRDIADIAAHRSDDRPVYLRPEMSGNDSRPVNFATAKQLASVCNTMRCWNLEFSGKESAETFIERLRDGRQLMPVPDAQLLSCLTFFMSGIALAWYRDSRDQWRSFDEFDVAFRTRFINRNYEHDLEREILTRTQGEYEPVADYLTCLHALISRVKPPWSEFKALDCMYHNMQPRLRLVIRLHEIGNFAQLQRSAVQAEEVYLSAQSFYPPPLPERSFNSELAYHPPKSSRSRLRPQASATAVSDFPDSDTTAFVPSKGNVVVSKSRPLNLTNSSNTRNQTRVSSFPKVTKITRTEPARAVTPEVNDENSPVCWNCDKPGHYPDQCPGERLDF